MEIVLFSFMWGESTRDFGDLFPQVVHGKRQSSHPGTLKQCSFLHPTTQGITHSRLGSRYMDFLQPGHFTCDFGRVTYPLRARFLSLQHSSECLLVFFVGVWWQPYRIAHVRSPFVSYKASNEYKPGWLFIQPLAHTWRVGTTRKSRAILETLFFWSMNFHNCIKISLLWGLINYSCWSSVHGLSYTQLIIP